MARGEHTGLRTGGTIQLALPAQSPYRSRGGSPPLPDPGWALVWAALLFSPSWTRGLLTGAIVAPTDAAAVSALLHLRQLELRARVAAVLEIESGINDPISVLLTVLLVDLLAAPAPLPASHIVALL